MAGQKKPNNPRHGGINNNNKKKSLCVWMALIALCIAVYAGTDPFRKSPIADFPDFQTYKIDMPAWNDWPRVSDEENRLEKSELKFVNEIHGPESIAFDGQGRGPYTGVADGRVLFWNGHSWTYFAHTSPNRTDELCSSDKSAMANIKIEHVCGRPLGLRFEKKSGDLYIADAYYGILVVGPQGGLATPLVLQAEGMPVKFANDLDVDSEGSVYFTDSSSVYPRRNFLQLLFSAEPSGRVIRYDPKTRQATVLVRNVQFPNGLTLSKDESFFLYAESCTGRLMRYWLKGPKQSAIDTFAVLPGHPDNVRRNEDGEFWVALHFRRNLYSHLMGLYPEIRKAALKIPVPGSLQYLAHAGGRPHAAAVKYGSDGHFLQILEDRKGKTVRAISEVEEKDGRLWMGSVLTSSIGVY
eukprot:TRINITY_DN10793_c0_g1_i1.p1 TRINITY_DN10793_c0_g1~~TRINITY_DN10793_c0_g1_i1.p1  ORF type:complete len:411 (+),score=65.10 TRINITY_DN10793_c0_g1_i1:174-1406(+)